LNGEATLIAPGFVAYRNILNPFLVYLTTFVGVQETNYDVDINIEKNI